MNMKDGDVTRWSPNSCDGSDMEECEARLYSMVYHTSNSYDDVPVNAKSSNFNVTSVNGNLEPNHNKQLDTSIGCSIIEEVDVKKCSSGNQKEFHHSSRNKASRLNAVNEIITNADTNRSKDLVIEANKCVTLTLQDDKNTSPKKQTVHTEVPKTASLYFQNLTKSLNNVQYLQSVQPRRITSLNSTVTGRPISRFCKSSSSNVSQSQNGLALTNFTFTDTCRHGDTSSITPVFRLDDRLFPNIPRNTSKEEVELSNRLFPNKHAGSSLFADRDRHNHLFNQLPTIPITNNVLSKKEKRQQKTAKRKEKRAQFKLRNKSSKSSSPEEIVQPSGGQSQVNANVSVPAILERLSAVLVQEQLGTRELDDSPIAVFDTRDTVSKVDVEEVINVDVTSTDEIINLDSDSDSVDSIVILTPPVRSPPPVIALEASDDETPINKVETIHPFLESELVENSFDFLDSSDETEGLVRSQAFLFSTLISSCGSKESLLDDRFFKTHEESVLEKNCAIKPSTSTRHTPDVNDAPVPKASVAEPQTKNLKPNSSEVAQANLSVVNLDESSQSVESVTTISEQAVKPTLDSLNDDIQVLHSGNVMNSMLVDLEINNLLIGSSNAQVVDSVLNVGGPVSEYSWAMVPKLKRTDGRNRRTDKKEAFRLSRLERRKRSKEKKLQKQNTAQQRSGMAHIVYTKIMGDDLIPMDEVRSRTPAHWTKEMRHFYNNSWGGENFDVADVQQRMSRDPSLWRVSWEDKRGPVHIKGPFSRSRCFNCFRFGHPAYHCPEATRLPKCYMCGEVGHKEANCKQRICLQCGRPSNKYSNGCWECQHIPFDLCVKCIWKHDPTKTCFDLRHKPIDNSVILELESAGQHNKNHSDTRPCTKTLADLGQSTQTESSDLRFQLEHKRTQFVGPPGTTNRRSDGGAKKRNWEESIERTSGRDVQYHKRHRSYHDVQREKYVGSPFYKKQTYRESR